VNRGEVEVFERGDESEIGAGLKNAGLEAKNAGLGPKNAGLERF
jgi:hypothetical protein